MKVPSEFNMLCGFFHQDVFLFIPNSRMQFPICASLNESGTTDRARLSAGSACEQSE